MNKALTRNSKNTTDSQKNSKESKLHKLLCRKYSLNVLKRLKLSIKQMLKFYNSVETRSTLPADLNTLKNKLSKELQIYQKIQNKKQIQAKSSICSRSTGHQVNSHFHLPKISITCMTCTRSSKAQYCFECFRDSDHENHSFIFSKDPGTQCNCGRSQGASCETHRSRSLNLPINSVSEFREVAEMARDLLVLLFGVLDRVYLLISFDLLEWVFEKMLLIMNAGKSLACVFLEVLLGRASFEGDFLENLQPDLLVKLNEKIVKERDTFDKNLNFLLNPRKIENLNANETVAGDFGQVARSIISKFKSTCLGFENLSVASLIFFRLHLFLRRSRKSAHNFRKSLDNMLLLGLQFQKYSPQIVKLRTDFAHLYSNFESRVHLNVFSQRQLYNDFICSKSFGQYLFKILARTNLHIQCPIDNQLLCSCGLKSILENLIWATEKLQNPFLKNPKIVKCFFGSGNFEIFIQILSVFEGVFAGKFIFLENNFEIFQKLQNNYNDFVKYLMTGIQRSKQRQEQIEFATKILSRLIPMTEYICKNANAQLPKMHKHRNRLGLNSKLYAVLIFAWTFTSDKGQRLILDSNLNRRARLELKGYNAFDDRRMLMNILKNIIYNVKCLSRCSNRLVNFRLDKFSLFGASVVIAKCIFIRRPELRVLAHDYLLTVLSEILLNRFKKRGKEIIVRRLFETVYNLFFDELLFEKLFLYLACQLCLTKNQMIRKDAFFDFLKQCPSLLELSRIYISLAKPLCLDSFIANIDFDLFGSEDTHLSDQVKHLMMEHLCVYDPINKIIKVRDSRQDPAKTEVFESLFAFRMKSMHSILKRQKDMLKNKQRPSKVFIYPNKRSEERLEGFADHMLEEAFDLFREFEKIVLTNESEESNKNSKKTRNDYLENMRWLMKHILVVLKVAHQFNFEESHLTWFLDEQREIYARHPKILKILLNLDTEWQNYILTHKSHNKVNLSKNKTKKTLKKKQKKFFKKIFKKVGKKGKSLQKQKASVNCTICHEPFTSNNETFVIVDFIDLSKKMRPKNSRSAPFTMLSTCGHFYHFECLPMPTNLQNIKCHFCQSTGQFHLGNTPILQLEKRRNDFHFHKHCYEPLTHLNVFEEIHKRESLKKLIQPIVGTIQMIKAFDSDIFNRRFAPNLQRLVNLVHNMFVVEQKLAADLVEDCQTKLDKFSCEFSSFGDLRELWKAFDIQKSKYRLCVEEALVAIFVYSYFIELYKKLKINFKKWDFRAVPEIARETLQESFQKLVPWFFLLKILQNPLQTKQAISFLMIKEVCNDILIILEMLQQVFGCDYIATRKGPDQFKGKHPISANFKIFSKFTFFRALKQSFAIIQWF